MNTPVQVRQPSTKHALLVHKLQIAAYDALCPRSPLYTAEETLCRDQPSWARITCKPPLYSSTQRSKDFISGKDREGEISEHNHTHVYNVW